MKTKNLGSHSRAAGWKQGLALLIGAMLGGCQSSQEALRSLAAHHNHRLEIISTRPFPLALSTPPKPIATSRIRLYIEGDGHAWATRSQPSLDPTPRNLLVAGLAFDDPTPSLYLARPCQFVMAAGCRPDLWTNRRFSDEVVISLEHALDQIKLRYGNRDYELIGYSGGAALAMLLAARRDDIAQIQTLAGNLSPNRWVQLHQLSPLSGSLNPDDHRAALARIPQRHLAGGKDKVVPPLLLRSYVRSLEQPVCIESEVIADASHADGWTQAWRVYRNRPLRCERRQVD
ncbi:alpha/beta hydrolase [Pseudomonas stutzeri]|uniref:alpha/beta hydrolase n=1 Tax=Stutzerimonas stutzeri TaxID=316 RepID=UPI00210AD6ED|nr:alpha/beta hydrolase [Stutzerimonas stutzeri]MCQ4289533.1 alpha/beta hydrolase [Stutzerimonas stutzeri]